MANAPRDDNRIPTMLFVQADGTPTLPLIDDVTGRLLVSIRAVASFPSPTSQTVDRDDNHVRTAAAVTSGGDVKAVLVDDTNGGIISTVTVE